MKSIIIAGVDATDNALYEALLSAAVVYAVEHDKDDVLFMADKGSVEIDAALSVGFQITGSYTGYKIVALERDDCSPYSRPV